MRNKLILSFLFAFFWLALPMAAQDLGYSGTVYDENGTPLIGAGVIKAGSTGGTITDLNGQYALNARPGDKIIVSYLGYIDQEIVLTEKTTLDIYLAEDTKMLEDAVVIGYGTASKKLISSSIAGSSAIVRGRFVD